MNALEDAQTTASASASEVRAHHRSGIRRVLESAWVYAAFKALVQPRAAQRRFVEDFIPLTANARVLDVGCGTGWLLEYLPDGIQYVGYDLNRKYIRAAEEKYGNRGTFFCADITEQPAKPGNGEAFDVVLALGLLHHLTDREAKHLCESAYAHLKPGGVFLTFDGTFVPGQSPIAHYLISRDRGRAVRSPEGYLALVEPLFGEVQRQTRTDLLRVPYTHFLMHCTK